MTGIEIKDITIIISGLITAVSTLLAVVITNFFNLKLSKSNSEMQAKQKYAEQRIIKIEETYLLFEKWEVNFSNIYLHHLRCYSGKLNYNQVLELTNKCDLMAPGEAQKLKMLILVHFPELEENYKEVDLARSKIAKFLCDPEKSKLRAKDFVIAQEAFEATCYKFKKEIGSLAHRN
ncbi:hypothetical protein [Aeromonas dhakensis]|uniref:hypothetical protein n=1 Tax=Aeromonas dhakensis TaxID=196024 RepID=UPI001F60CDD0|nr:hypothetical protein [Aeromonas dhakensis]UNU87107.1 hypothetical protein GB930_02340 [Aeromonas dhakensis]HDZ8893833.1 hypothetical protein [Aeromonas dhakensis]